MLRTADLTDTAGLIAGQLGGVDPAAVQEALGTALRYRHKNAVLRGEFAEILSRYDHLLSEENDPGPGKTDPNRGFGLVAEYFNPMFSPGKAEYRSLRIRNDLEITCATEGPQPFHVSYMLYDAANSSLITEGVRSRFPVALRSGCEMTVPVRIVPPEAPGKYLIKIMVVQEYVRWYDQPPLFEASLIVHNERNLRPEMRISAHSGSFEFDKDIAFCGQIYETAVEGLKSQGCLPLYVLEIACGSDPQSLRHYQPGTHVVASDLSFPQAQFGSLLFSRNSNPHPDDYVFISCDALNAPFREGTFDLLVVCAALHHFSDVTLALQRAKTLLRPHGRILLLREPAKVFPEDPIFIKELLNGFNEQQFELAEYDIMYQRAGLRICYEQLDFECSYKALVEAI